MNKKKMVSLVILWKENGKKHFLCQRMRFASKT